jgi:Family of unknown function (DUF6510)
MTDADDGHLDGNAVGGLLIEVFGHEMTDARGCCAACGAVNAVGALLVYRSGPGDVVRCPGCEAAVMIVVPHEDRHRIHFSGMRWLEPAWG